MTALIELLVYAAALDVYRRINRREIRLASRETSAVLDLADWTARPALLDRGAA